MPEISDAPQAPDAVFVAWWPESDGPPRVAALHAGMWQFAEWDAVEGYTSQRSTGWAWFWVDHLARAHRWVALAAIE